MKTFAVDKTPPATAGSQPASLKSFWIRESPGKAIDVPHVAALNLLPPDTVPDRVLRKIGREYDALLGSRGAAFGARSANMEHYVRFGEECAARNIVPTYRLFEQWCDADAISHN